MAGAEDALSEAFAAALADWPQRGVPDNPEAWLLVVARRKLVDAVRARIHGEAAAEHLQLLAQTAEPEDSASGLPDRRLELLFACAHPAIDRAVRAPLMLQAVLGFDAATIASAFLVAPAAMGQRLVRAKTKIRQAGIAFQVPERSQLPERLDSVLEAIYAAYAEGWSDAEGADPMRRNLADEAIWLGRLVVALLPDEPEALGLLALMLHAHARRRARRDAQGEYVPLAEQDIGLWDSAMIDEAESLLLRASRLEAPGRYQLEAAVQSAHCVRRREGRADWAAIVTLYEALHALTGSPVAALNRAVALAQAEGTDAGLAALEALAAMRGWRSTSPTGRPGPNCCHAVARWCRHWRPTSRRSGWSAIPRCGVICSAVRRCWASVGGNIVMPDSIRHKLLASRQAQTPLRCSAWGKKPSAINQGRNDFHIASDRHHGEPRFVFGTLKEEFPNFSTDRGIRVPGSFKTVTPYPLYLVASGTRHGFWTSQARAIVSLANCIESTLRPLLRWIGWNECPSPTGTDGSCWNWKRMKDRCFQRMPI